MIMNLRLVYIHTETDRHTHKAREIHRHTKRESQIHRESEIEKER